MNGNAPFKLVVRTHIVPSINGFFFFFNLLNECDIARRRFGSNESVISRSNMIPVHSRNINVVYPINGRYFIKSILKPDLLVVHLLEHALNLTVKNIRGDLCVVDDLLLSRVRLDAHNNPECKSKNNCRHCHQNQINFCTKTHVYSLYQILKNNAQENKVGPTGTSCTPRDFLIF